MEYLRDRSICLEMCPTSNWLTRCVPTFEAHPLPAVLRAGIPVCINTDDPGIFDVTMPGEIQICREKMGMSAAEIAQCTAHAVRASFLNP
jgi:adenosine deaminase